MIRVYEHDGERISVDLPDLAAHERYERDRSRLWKGMERLSRTSGADTFRLLAVAWLRNSSAFHHTYPTYVPRDVRELTATLRHTLNIDDVRFATNDFGTAGGGVNGASVIDCGGADEDDNGSDEPWALAISFENVCGKPACIIHDLDNQARNGCAECGKKSSNNRLCSRCRQTMYCSEECQGKHWNEHQKTCVALCGYCKGQCEQNLVCGRCRRVWYCTESCQRQDWKRHKTTCKARGTSNEQG